MSRAFAAVAVLSACGGSPAHAPIANHGPAAPFERADLAVRDGGDLRFYSLAGERVTEVMKVHLADGVEPSWLATNPHSFGWIDHDHLIAAMGDKVTLVTAAGSQPIAVPPAESLTAPKPAKADGLEAGGVLGLIIGDGEAWWTGCAWGFVADGFQCSLYVQVRIWPSPARRVSEGVVESQSGWGWSDTVPKGYAAKENEGGKTIACQPPNGPATELRSADDEDMLEDVHWISASPPRLFVQYGGMGMTVFQTRWAIFDGCNEKPIDTGTYSEPGPGGLWIATSDRVTLRRGAHVLGAIPEADVHFRPAK